MIEIIGNKKINDYFKYFLIFITIYFGRDTLVSSSFIGFLPCYIIQTGILIILFINLVIKVHKKKIDYREKAKHFIVVFVLIILSMILNGAYTLMYFSIIYAIFYSIVLSFYFNYDDFFEKYINIMIFLILYSFFASLFLNKIIHISFISNLANFKFNNLLFCFVPTLDGYVRIFGIFREPGVYQFFILLAIYYLLIQNKIGLIKYSKIKLIILLLGIITTFSVTGYICLILLLFISLLQNINIEILKENIAKYTIIAIIFSIIIIATIYLNKSIYWMVYSMIIKIKNLGNSDPRVNSIIYNIYMFIKSPIIGTDINTILGGIQDNTSSIFTIFSTFGIIVGVLFTLLYYNFLELKFESLHSILISFLKIILIFILLNCECLITNIYLYCAVIIYYYSLR